MTRPCMVMELMKCSLSELLHDTPLQFLSWERRTTICLQVVGGLRYLHSRHILHRDLSSHNVLLDNDFNVNLG